MRSTVDIPNDDLDQLLKYTGAPTKKEAVVQAVQGFNRRHRLGQLAEILGTFDDFMDANELNAMRQG
jgi:hypothetical protein